MFCRPYTSTYPQPLLCTYPQPLSNERREKSKMYMRANAPALSLPYCPSLSPSTVFLPVVLGRVRGRFSLPLKSKNQKKNVRIKIICIGFPFSKIIDVDVLNVHCQVGKQKGRGHARTRVCGCIHTHPNITHHSAAYINDRMGSGQNNARARALSLSLSLSLPLCCPMTALRTTRCRA